MTPDSPSHDTLPDSTYHHPVHPIGTAAGAASGAVAAGALTGFALGSVAGPFGAAIGAAAAATIGAFAGGYAGNVAAEHMNPTTEEAYWRLHFAGRSYAPGCNFDMFKEAYAFGGRMRYAYPDKTFHEVLPQLQEGWAANPASAALPWNKACDAICDAWDHLCPHDPDL